MFRKQVLILAVLIFFVCTAFNISFVHAVERTVFVHLFEWKWKDIAKECEDFLGPKGFAAVQISPPHEHLVLSGGSTAHPWWQRYQPVSYILKSRGGTLQELKDMISRCNQAGVKVYADVVINHMVSDDSGSGTGSAGTFFDPATKQYTAVPYGPNDFHNKCGIDYGDANSIRNCWLGSLQDLRTETNYVRQKIADYLNNLISIGVAGFRIDAAKHMQPADIADILSRVNQLGSAIDPHTGQPYHQAGPPYVYQEVIEGANEPVKAHQYTGTGDVTEFKYGTKVGAKFRDPSQKISELKTFPGPPGAADWGILPSFDAVVFTDNHDNQRGHGSGYWQADGKIGGILTFHYDGSLYNLANVYMLAWPYGYPKVMSSYDWPRNVQLSGGKHRDLNDWMGPPSDSSGNTNDAACFSGGWICEHRWGNIANMVAFRNYTVSSWTVDNLWDNGNNQIAFGRGDRGFVVINREGNTLLQTLQTGMSAGSYCDVLHGNFDETVQTCSGPTITVNPSGMAHFSVPPMQASAIHVGAKVATAGPVYKRTVVFMYAPTVTGQDMFLRGGIDHGHAESVLGKTCSTAGGPTYECSLPIQHNNSLNSTTQPWKVNDNYLDWYDQREPGQDGWSQGIQAMGTAADWTTNDPGYGATVAVNGFGYEVLNQLHSLGEHYWMLDVNMDCSRGVQFGGESWFELKAYISGVGWEGHINQSGTPYSSNNHFAKCGKINIFQRNEDSVAFHNFQ
jgi:alpha-amylase